MSESLSSKAARATAWSSITEIMAKFISPIVNMVLARVLAPTEFGIIATITMVISFAEIFTDAGFQKYLIQQNFDDEKALNDATNVAFWTNLSISLLACVAIFIFRDHIATFVGSPGLGDSISIASLLIILAAFSSIQTARYKRDLNFKPLFFVRIGSSLIPLVVTVPLALILKNYWALLIGTYATHLFNSVALTLMSRWKPRFNYKWHLFNKMFSFTSWTLLESISIWLTANIGVFIIANKLNEYYLGLYKTSMTTINAYMGIITSAIAPVLFSTLSKYQSNEDGFQNTYFVFQRLTAIFVIPMGVGIFVFSDFVTQILLGAQWLEASRFIGLWGLMSSLTIVFSHFSSEVFRSKGQPRASLVVQLIHLAFLIPALLISANFGFDILCVARALIRIQLIITALIIMKVKFNFHILQIVCNVLPMIVSALVMGIVGIVLKTIDDTVAWQIICVLICMIVYFCILLCCFPKTRRELFESKIAKKFLKR